MLFYDLSLISRHFKIFVFLFAKISFPIAFHSVFQRELEEKLLNMKLKSSKIEELLPKRISNSEQRDILTLLCKVHELELEKTEIQSAVLCKENVLRTKDFIIQRHEQQQTLCDDIIHQQKALIEGMGH